MSLPAHHPIIIDRFIAACQADERVVAAILYGSYARGAADVYSDLDLGLITTDDTYEDFVAGRAAFIRLLGEPVFLEDFDSPHMAFIIFSDGAEVELTLGRESQLNQNHGDACQVLLDKKNLLADATFLRQPPTPAEQVEKLRRLIYWFWHDFSHFTTALGRGQLWWAHGQLDVLRLMCVNLARLRHNFADPDVGEEGYFKIEQAMPIEALAPLQATFCPMEADAMLRAGFVILNFYRDVAQILAQTHGLTYPTDLDRAKSARLEALRKVRLS